MVRSKELVEKITEACGWIAPVTAYAGEFEMEAMAAGAIRALEGIEPIKTYTGQPIWDKADFEE
jgi:butyrate kinase